ncbi:MAG TPA: ABC transporter permease [Dehalococcoidia bacterium]|nr:ABC transporter permease [Dehalococcoidia bacterium]
MHIDVKKEIRESGPGKTGLVILLVMIAVALLAPVVALHEPSQQSTASLLSPSLNHWLGTNHVGQDIWSRLLFGARTSLLVGFGVGILSTLLGTIFGVSAALVGGLYEKVVMRIVDAFIVIPMVIIVVLVAAYLRPSLLVLILLLSLLSWQGGARVIRAQALSLKERGHVAAARSFGANHFYIACRHIVPDLGPILLVDFIYGVRRAVVMEAGLAFLGISDPTLVSWGMMMRDALSFSYLDVWRWWLIPTGVALSLTIIGLTFIGYAAEPVIEPRLRGAEVA